MKPYAKAFTGKLRESRFRFKELLACPAQEEGSTLALDGSKSTSLTLFSKQSTWKSLLPSFWGEEEDAKAIEGTIKYHGLFTKVDGNTVEFGSASPNELSKEILLTHESNNEQTVEVDELTLCGPFENSWITSTRTKEHGRNWVSKMWTSTKTVLSRILHFLVRQTLV